MKKYFLISTILLDMVLNSEWLFRGILPNTKKINRWDDEYNVPSTAAFKPRPTKPNEGISVYRDLNRTDDQLIAFLTKKLKLKAIIKLMAGCARGAGAEITKPESNKHAHVELIKRFPFLPLFYLQA